MPAPTPDELDVQAAVDFLSALSEDKFAQALADAVMADPEDPETAADLYGMDTPDPVPLAAAVAAFRGPALINRSLPAAKYLIDHVNTVMRHVAPKEGLSTSQAQRYREVFRSKVGRERQILKAALDGWKAQKGILDNAPNPRARAMRELKQRHLREYQALTRKYQQAIKDERAQKRREQKAAAKARKTPARV